MIKKPLFIPLLLAVSALLITAGYFIGRPDGDELNALCAPYARAAVQEANAEAVANAIEASRKAVEDGGRAMDEYERKEYEIAEKFAAEVSGASESVLVDERLCRAACDAYAAYMALHTASANNTVRPAVEAPVDWDE